MRGSSVDDERLKRLASDQWHGEVEIVSGDEGRDRGNNNAREIITVWWD